MNLYRTKLSEKLKEVIGSGGTDHRDRIDIKLYDRTGAAGHSDGFIIGAILLVVGMMFFTLGAEMSMYRGQGYRSLCRLAAWAEERHCSFL